MSQQDFVTALEQALQFCGYPFSRAALQAFVADAWPLIDDRPDVGFWATEFIAAGNVEALA
jgi:hypothetical protein